MAGFLGALLAGAVGGLGTGMAANAQNSIEDKRQAKRDALAASLQKSQQDFLASEGTANRASQKELALAQLATNERLGALQAKTTTSVAELGAKVDRERIASAEKQANAQIAAAKDLAEFQAGSEQKLNSRLVQVEKDGKITNVLMTPDGQEIPKLKGPDGKEYDWVGPDASTDAGKNYNFMIANGFDPVQAGKWAFGAKSDDRAAIEAGLLKSMIGANITSPTEDQMVIYRRMAKEGTDGILGAEAPAAPAATTPAPPAAATSTASAPPAPTDKKLREDGKVYVTPNGVKGKWNAATQGWDVVQ